jgi:hypothetical protein
MKSRFLAILAFLLTALLLTACPPTTPRNQAPYVGQVTQILEDDLTTPAHDLGLASSQAIDYSMYPPGTVFFTNEDGSLANTRIVPELSKPEWDARDFPKGFSTTLVSGHWKKFQLAPTTLDQGYLVDVTPQEASTEGAEVVSIVMPEYNGESWVDVLWLFQPKEAAPLPVYVKVYTTAGWPIAYHDQLSLEPGVWQGYIFGKASDPGGYVVEVSSQGTGAPGDTLQRIMVNPEFPGGWQDVLRIQTLPNQAPMQADVAIYRSPLSFLKTEATLHMQPGEWATGILGLAEEQAAYVMKVSPLSATDNQIESYGVEPVFMDGAWRDVYRLKIPADRPPMDVNVRVYAVTPGSRSGQLEQIPSTTPDRLATEWAAYLFDTPTATKLAARPTATVTPSVPDLAGCPEALPSRLQVGQSGMVSLDPPVANRVRSEPDREAEVLGQMMPGEKFSVLNGPRCADGWTWWRVRSRAQELEGWTSEGDEKTYWLQPATTPTPTSTPTRLANVEGCIESPAGLISWWPGDGNADDLQGENDGMLIDGASFAPGMVGQAFSFDGKNRVVASTAALPIYNSDRTLALWVKANTFLEGEAFFAGYGRFKAYNQAYELGAAGSTLFFSQWGGAIFGPVLQTGRWYHLAVTNSDTKVKLYLDGKLVASGDLPIDTAAGTKLFMGNLPDLPDEPVKRLDGLIDEVGVYNRALSAAEIHAIYQAGSQGQCKPGPRATHTPSPTLTKPVVLPSVTPTPGKPPVTNTPSATSTPVITGAGSSSPRAASLKLHLIGNAWSGIFLGETNYPWGYLVDVTPLEPSVDGAHIESYIRTWFDGTQWVDYLFVGLPHPDITLDVQVDIYITQDWPVANQGEMSLPAAKWYPFYLGEAAQNAAYVLDVNPLQPSTKAVGIIPSAVMPEYSDGVWWDMERLELYIGPLPIEAQVTAYRAPSLPVTTFDMHLEPGVWHGVSLGPASQEQAYLVEVDPLSPGKEGYRLEKVAVQPEFDGANWKDVLRVMIPQDQSAMDVRVKVYTLKP